MEDHDDQQAGAIGATSRSRETESPTEREFFANSFKKQPQVEEGSRIARRNLSAAITF